MRSNANDEQARVASVLNRKRSRETSVFRDKPLAEKDKQQVIDCLKLDGCPWVTMGVSFEVGDDLLVERKFRK